MSGSILFFSFAEDAVKDRDLSYKSLSSIPRKTDPDFTYIRETPEDSNFRLLLS